MLWQSVDEHGPDPMLPFKAELAEKQKAMRDMSQVEVWLRQHTVVGSQEGKRQQASSLYEAYKAWADTYYPGQVMTLSQWGKEFRRVINEFPNLGWSIAKRNAKGEGYTYNSVVI